MAEKITPRDITHALRSIGSVGFNSEPYTLSSGVKTHVYFNVGDKVISDPNVKEMVAEAMVQTWEHLCDSSGGYPDRFIGVPEGMNMLTSSIGDRIGVGQLRVRETVRGHGRQGSVEASFEPNMSIGINEDVVSSGHSIVNRVVKPLVEAGLRPVAVVSLIDRQYQGSKYLRHLNLNYRSFTTTSEMAMTLLTEGNLSDQEMRLLLEEVSRLKVN
jgi:orotate phosphoribosyltransferase